MKNCQLTSNGPHIHEQNKIVIEKLLVEARLKKHKNKKLTYLSVLLRNMLQCIFVNNSHSFKLQRNYVVHVCDIIS